MGGQSISNTLLQSQVSSTAESCRRRQILDAKQQQPQSTAALAAAQTIRATGGSRILVRHSGQVRCICTCGYPPRGSGTPFPLPDICDLRSWRPCAEARPPSHCASPSCMPRRRGPDPDGGPCSEHRGELRPQQPQQLVGVLAAGAARRLQLRRGAVPQGGHGPSVGWRHRHSHQREPRQRRQRSQQRQGVRACRPATALSAAQWRMAGLPAQSTEVHRLVPSRGLDCAMMMDLLQIRGSRCRSN